MWNPVGRLSIIRKWANSKVQASRALSCRLRLVYLQVRTQPCPASPGGQGRRSLGAAGAGRSGRRKGDGGGEPGRQARVSRAGAGVRLRRLKPGAGRADPLAGRSGRCRGNGGPGRGLGAAGGAVRSRPLRRAGARRPYQGRGEARRVGVSGPWVTQGPLPEPPGGAFQRNWARVTRSRSRFAGTSFSAP